MLSGHPPMLFEVLEEVSVDDDAGDAGDSPQVPHLHGEQLLSCDPCTQDEGGISTVKRRGKKFCRSR